jgi:hypothetical protein
MLVPAFEGVPQCIVFKVSVFTLEDLTEDSVKSFFVEHNLVEDRWFGFLKAIHS